MRGTRLWTTSSCSNEVTNPFAVTEVYVKDEKDWKLASMSFTRLLTPPSK